MKTAKEWVKEICWASTVEESEAVVRRIQIEAIEALVEIACAEFRSDYFRIGPEQIVEDAAVVLRRDL